MYAIGLALCLLPVRVGGTLVGPGQHPRYTSALQGEAVGGPFSLSTLRLPSHRQHFFYISALLSHSRQYMDYGEYAKFTFA